LSHRNAALTPRHRLRVARLVIEDGWPISEVAARFQVSWPTVKRWADRYLAGEPMQDRSSRPKSSPNKTSIEDNEAVREPTNAPEGRAGATRAPARHRPVHGPPHPHQRPRMNRLSYVDRATGEAIRRYEHDHPGSLVHVDVKKIGNIPDGGGWRYVGRRQGEKNPSPTLLTSRINTWARSSGTRSCTPSSTITPASRTPRSRTTRPQ
jgi:transposase-like protein